MSTHLDSIAKKHEALFWKGQRGMLIFCAPPEELMLDDSLVYPMGGYMGKLSKDFLQSKAYDLGIEAVRSAHTMANQHRVLEDDCYPCISAEWGVGLTTALFTGQDVIFKTMTSYTKEPYVTDWEMLDNIKFDLGNQWMNCLCQFWKGVESAYDDCDFAVTPYLLRSPLDLAVGLRGNEIYIDMYENPEMVEHLLKICTEWIIQLDKHLRDEITILRHAPGGVWGCVLNKPTLFLNGDPVDLISVQMGERFNTPFIEKLIDYTGSLYFHHHSIGISRAKNISEIKGLAVQQIHQDPNGPTAKDILCKSLIEASLETPIHTDSNFFTTENCLELTRKLCNGRLIVTLWPKTVQEAHNILKKIRGAFP